MFACLNVAKYFLLGEKAVFIINILIFFIEEQKETTTLTFKFHKYTCYYHFSHIYRNRLKIHRKNRQQKHFLFCYCTLS